MNPGEKQSLKGQLNAISALIQASRAQFVPPPPAMGVAPPAGGPVMVDLTASMAVWMTALQQQAVALDKLIKVVEKLVNEA